MPPRPAVDANQTLERRAHEPRSWWCDANGFFDEDAGAAYAPARYSDHGTGLFFVGTEDSGLVFAYALDHR